MSSGIITHFPSKCGPYADEARHWLCCAMDKVTKANRLWMMAGIKGFDRQFENMLEVLNDAEQHIADTTFISEVESKKENTVSVESLETLVLKVLTEQDSNLNDEHSSVGSVENLTTGQKVKMAAELLLSSCEDIKKTITIWEDHLVERTYYPHWGGPGSLYGLKRLIEPVIDNQYQVNIPRFANYIVSRFGNYRPLSPVERRRR